MASIDKTTFAGQGNCYKLSNGTVEVIAPTEIGPRILGYRFVGGENILAELPETESVETELGTWHVRGGHRLWHAPEGKPRSYSPDDDPVRVELIGETGIRLTQLVEPSTQIEKEMLIQLDDEGSRVAVVHKLTNRGLWTVSLAPWALTVVRGGGVTIVPNEPFIPHTDRLLPARPMTLWNYTDLSDSRLKFGKKFTLLRSDENLKYPNKFGVANTLGWAGYLVDDMLFVKRFGFVEGAEYPDYGCNFETFTNGSFMEVESVGPLGQLEPGQSTIHIEEWYLFKGVNAGDTEESMEAAIMPFIEKTAS